MILTPAQRRHLEVAASSDGEIAVGHHQTSVHRMRRRFVDAGLVEFDPKRMGYFITAKGRELVAALPPIKRKPSYRAGGRVSEERF